MSLVKDEPSAVRFPVSGRLVMARFAIIALAYLLLVLFAFHLWPSWTAVLPPLGCGFILSGFLNAAHDCVHARHLSDNRLNRICGAAWCTPILVNFTLYRAQHLTHHRFTGVDGDSEPQVTFRTAAEYLFEQSGAIFWRNIFARIVKTFRGDFPVSKKNGSQMVAAKVDNLVICLYLAVALGLTLKFPTAMLLGVWLPLVCYPPFAIFFSLPEHYGLNGPGYTGAKSRNMISNPVVRFFQWNANFHAAHHRAPGVPSVWLEAFHRDSGDPDAEVNENSYLSFHVSLVADLLWRTRRPEAGGSAN